MTLNCIWWWGFSSRDRRNVKYSFITINSQAQSDPRTGVRIKLSSISQVSLKIICIWWEYLILKDSVLLETTQKGKYKYTQIRSWQYLSMPPTREDLTQGLFYSGVKEEPRLVRCGSMLIIGSFGAMRAMPVSIRSLGTYATWPCLLFLHSGTNARQPVEATSGSETGIDRQSGQVTRLTCR